MTLTLSVANPSYFLYWKTNHHKFSGFNNTFTVSVSPGEESRHGSAGSSSQGPTGLQPRHQPGPGLLQGSPLLPSSPGWWQDSVPRESGQRPQLLAGCWLEATLSPLSCGPFCMVTYPSKPAEELAETLPARLKTVFCNVVGSDIHHCAGEKQSWCHPYSRGQRA